MGKLILNGVEYINNRIDGYPPIIYSGEEREVGVWTDGRPLYEKTIWKSGVSAGTEQNLITASDVSQNIGLMVEYSASFYDSDKAVCINADYYENSNYCTYARFTNSAGFKTYIKWGSSSFSYLKVVCQYTKTTDTPGSAKWSPSGLPAKHYSTNEKVIGTWIDGKPLYEITYDTGAINAGSNKTVDISSLNIDYVSEIKGCGYSSQYNQSLPLPFVHSQSVYVISVNTTSSNANLQISTGSGVSLSKSSITIRYTKTTD